MGTPAPVGDLEALVNPRRGLRWGETRFGGRRRWGRTSRTPPGRRGGSPDQPRRGLPERAGGQCPLPSAAGAGGQAHRGACRRDRGLV